MVCMWVLLKAGVMVELLFPVFTTGSVVQRGWVLHSRLVRTSQYKPRAALCSCSCIEFVCLLGVRGRQRNMHIRCTKPDQTCTAACTGIDLHAAPPHRYPTRNLGMQRAQPPPKRHSRDERCGLTGARMWCWGLP